MKLLAKRLGALPCIEVLDSQAVKGTLTKKIGGSSNITSVAHVFRNR